MTTETVTEYRDLLVEIAKDRALPAGHAGWAVRTIRLDFTSQHGYRYPYPGQVAEAPGPIIASNTDACPEAVGDGICAALNWRGMASGGESARLLLLVAYRQSDVLGESAEKLRLSQMLIVDVLSGEDVVKDGERANLYGANLRSANLHGANLRSANLRSADLYGADLRSANLYGADLHGADLRSANLHGADLRSANLRSADLHGADLYGANLYGADLRSADLRSANLHGANLHGADLHGANLRSANLRSANLRSANLRSANLHGAVTNKYTRLPEVVTIP